MGYDGMRQADQTYVEGEVGVHRILPCGIGLRQDSVAIQDVQDTDDGGGSDG